MAEAHDSIPFSITANDPEDNLLTYTWKFGDGNTSTEESPVHEYPVAGEYTVEVTVSDGTKSKKHTISVTVNPFETSISGGDEDGASWTVIAGGIAGAILLVVIVLLVLLRMKGGKPDDLESRAPSEGMHGATLPLEVPAPPEEERPQIIWEEGDTT